MATATQRPKLVAIVGPTASGKSDLAMRLAGEFDGEIICGDSRTVYKSMDIGTAKPTPEDQAEVKHWGLDLVEPGQRFTAADFKKYAGNAIADIRSRDKLPILVGGTGLYIDSVIFDFGFRDDINLLKRQKLEGLSVPQLQKIIQEKGYKMPENKQNKRHLIRTVETKGQAGSRKNRLPTGVILVGILPTDEVIKARTGQRAKQIFADGILNETKKIVRKYGKEAIYSTGGIVYGICLKVLEGSVPEAEAIEEFQKADWQYARRQKTWFKRNPHINWFNSPEVAYKAIKKQLLNT
ncbi:MAG: tRNA (adenosine(37)-N6)-dimethylallyltransferase MiaA [bacterium]|nr:tRNA (adenosine(37)-N6)-dimethylallyltransferase MiaA [bacterium]